MGRYSGHQPKLASGLQRALDGPDAALGPLGQGGVRGPGDAARAAVAVQLEQHVAVVTGQVPVPMGAADVAAPGGGGARGMRGRRQSSGAPLSEGTPGGRSQAQPSPWQETGLAKNCWLWGYSATVWVTS